MSEPNKELRKMSDIEAEYGGLVQRAGQLQYQIHILSSDLNLLNGTLRDLNIEAAKVKEKESNQTKGKEENAQTSN